MKAGSNHGFTLWELLVTVAVMGVVLGIGVPNLLEFSRNSVMTSTANELVSALMAARTESIKRQVPVTLCASADPLAAEPVCSPDGSDAPLAGYFVWVDENGNLAADQSPDLSDPTDGNAAFDAGETVLLRRDLTGRVTGAITLVADRYFVAYDAAGNRRAGVPTAVAGTLSSATTLLLCDTRGNVPSSGSLSAARALRIDPLGRSQMVRDVAEIDAAVADRGLACP